MSDVLDLRWGELFSALGMSPGTRATVDPYVYKKEAFTSVSQLNQSYNKNQRMTILTDLLSPFFLPHVSYNDVFEIARAGESSAHMFRLFQERLQISSVLHICKRIKAEKLTNICHMGPIVLLDTIASLFDHSNGQSSDADDGKNMDQLDEVINHLYSHFAHTSAAWDVKCFAEACLNSDEVVIAGSDLIHILQSMVAWPLLRCDDLSWAQRHDEIALRLKNLNLPGIESRQRQAAAMMEEAIVAFDQAGAVNDAAIARSNLGNLISTAAWLTVDQRGRRATALYDAAVEGAEEPHFRALLKDNIAGNFGRAANLGLPVPARKGVELAKQAAAELEALGETERLPLVLTNVANHLLQLRDDRTNRARDLREAREFAARGLELLQAAGRGVDPTQVRYVQHLLADITVRLADYDKPEAKEHAFEAARLLSDSSKFTDEARRTDLLYARAKARNISANYEAALSDLAEIKNDNRAKQDHPGFYCEVLELALSVTKKLYKRGDPARRAAAEELANYAKSKNVVSAWIDAEWQFLQECLFAAGSQEFGNVELPIDQAELALSQVGLDIDDTIKLQIVLASAYALRARNHLSMDDLQSAALIFTDISPSAPPVDVRVLGANILMTWIQLALHDYETGIEATSVQDVIEYLSTTDSASNSELVPSSQPLDEDPEPDIRVICEAARLILLSLGSGEGEQSSLMLARRVHAFREELSVDSTSRNGVWLSPIMAPVESRLFARAGLHELAIGTLRTALGQVEGGVFRQQILENLYLTLSEVDLPRTIIEIIIQGSRAAAWTYNEEVKEGFDPSRLKEHVRAALAVFARSKLETAQSAGVLHTARAEPESNTFEGQTLGSAIVNSGFPEIDNVEFPVNQGDVISDTGIIVILLPGHSAGTAIVIPRGGRIRDAIPVVLPRFSRRFVESIYFSGEAGWMRALLRWRNKMEIKPFDAAIRSVAVQLWDTAIGPVVETLQRMEADAGVELIVDARHRLLPWSCASPSLEMGEVAGDLPKMSNGVDLGTLILGQARQRAGISRPSRPSVMTHAALLVTAPFLADRSEQARIFNDFSGADFEMISIVDGINDLPMSRVEGDCLRSAFAEKTISFEGGLPRLLAPQVMPLLERARILHLASHGFWSPTHPWASAIMLGPEFPLFAANIRSDLRLQGATVLLSACESGMGGTGIPDRDGIVDEGGLVHAFLLSGAQSVLASSWIVHDLSSVVFMEMVFTELASGADIFTAATKARQFVRSMSSSDLASLINRAARVRPDLSEALHRSADELLIGDAHPFSSPVYWGAQFVASVGGRKALQT